MKILTEVEPIALYVAVTFIAGVCFLNLRKHNHRLLLLILFISFITEIFTLLLINFKKNTGLLYSISMIIHSLAWLYVLYQKFKPRAVQFILGLFLLYSLINLFFFEGTDDCNFNTFIAGAFIYILGFIFISFTNLKSENFSFFLSNNYLLIASPVFFFFGLSFIFGFKSQALADTQIVGNLNLYQVIGYFANITYYTLINIYIYREKKLANA